MAKKTAATDEVLRELRAYGLAYPGAHLKSPWPGHLDLAVKDKTFAYLSLEGEPLAVSCKLPRSSEVALMLPFCKPAAYGLGKSGWVAASFADHTPDVAMLKAWIDESYRAQAPKKLVAMRDAAGGDEAPAVAPTSARRASVKAVKPGPKPAKSASSVGRPSSTRAIGAKKRASSATARPRDKRAPR